MNVEVPQFRRCCFCIPLRYGILFWGYLNLLGSVFVTAMLGIMSMFLIGYGADASGIVLLVVLIGASLMDTAFNVLLVVAAHQKNYKLLKLFFYYSIISLAIGSFLYILQFSFEIKYTLTYSRSSFRLLKRATLGLLYIVLKIYIIILIRSEFIKLKNDTTVQFVNNAAEAECSLNVAVREKKRETYDFTPRVVTKEDAFSNAVKP